MRILVTVKFTPDLQSNRSFTEGTVTRTADDGSMNELDENAVEAALQLVEAAGEGEVYALTVGGPDAVAAVRKALQLGVTTRSTCPTPASPGPTCSAPRRCSPPRSASVHDGGAARPGHHGHGRARRAHVDAADRARGGARLVAADPGVGASRLPTASRRSSATCPTLTRPSPRRFPPSCPSPTRRTSRATPTSRLIMAARTAPVTAWTLADIGVGPVDRWCGRRRAPPWSTPRRGRRARTAWS